jgi:hypothetical protein
MLAYEGAGRMGDGFGFQAGGGDLVQKRPKGVIITLIEHQDVHTLVAQDLDRFNAAKASTYNYNFGSTHSF